LSAFGQLVSAVGNKTNELNSKLAQQRKSYYWQNASSIQHQSSGVNLDEEAAKSFALSTSISSSGKVMQLPAHYLKHY